MCRITGYIAESIACITFHIDTEGVSRPPNSGASGLTTCLTSTCPWPPSRERFHNLFDLPDIPSSYRTNFPVPKCRLAPPTRCSLPSNLGRWTRVPGWLSLLSYNDDEIGSRTDHRSARSSTDRVPSAGLEESFRSYRSRSRADPLDVAILLLLKSIRGMGISAWAFHGTMFCS